MKVCTYFRENDEDNLDLGCRIVYTKIIGDGLDVWQIFRVDF